MAMQMEATDTQLPRQAAPRPVRARHKSEQIRREAGNAGG
jgi:hypothetical protein